MKTVNVSELEGAALDWAVAIAIGLDGRMATSTNGVSRCYIPGPNRYGGSVYLRGEVETNIFGKVKPESLEPIGYVYSPSTDWNQVGPLIDGLKVSVEWYGDTDEWCADTMEPSATNQFGPTPLIAACRAIVAAKIGETVDVPGELL